MSIENLNDILASQDQTNQFLDQIKHLAESKLKIIQAQDIYKEDVKATKEAFEVDTSIISKLVNALVKDIVDGEIETYNSLSDVLTLIKEREITV